MTTFDCLETEKYFRDISRKTGIVHVSWAANHVITKEDVNELLSAMRGQNSIRIESEPFYECP